MSRKQFRLNAANTAFPIDLDFMASHIAIDNPTASPVFVRIGAPDTPTEVNADIYVAAGASKSYPVHARSFAVAFGSASSLASPSTSGLFTTAIVTLYSEDEQLPAYGSASFLSLSISDLTSGLTAITNPTTVSTVFDIGAWGGAIIHVSLNAGSGQANVLIEISNSPSSGFRTFQILSAWPLIPVTINMPRVARYFRVTITNAAIPAQPAVAGVYSVRATLEEIVEFAYQVTGSILSNAYNIANLSESSYILATSGLPSVSIAVRETGGTGLYGQIIVETSTAVGGPWTFATTREQNISSGGSSSSMYRTIGTLGPFTRVRLLNNGVAGAIVGTIEFGIPTLQDLAGVLNDIYKTLGDVSQPVSVGQSLYSLLLNWLPVLGTINTNTDGLETLVTSTNTILGSTNSLLASIATKLDTIIAQPNGGALTLPLQYNVAVAGAWQNIGAVLNVGWYIVSVKVNYLIGAVAMSPTFLYQLGYGTAGAITGGFYGGGGIQPEGAEGVLMYVGPKSGGLLIPAGQTNLWAFCSIAPVVLNLIIISRPP